MDDKIPSIDEVKNLHQQGAYAEAKAGYELIIRNNPNDIDALHMLGVLCAEQGLLDEAVCYLERAIALDNTNTSLMLHLANIYKAKNQFDEAITLLFAVIRQHPEYPAAYNNLGTVYYAQSRWLDAVNAFQQAISHQADYVDAYYNLGLALSKLNRRDESVHAFEALLALAPKHAGAHFQLGSLFMQMYNYKAAIEQYLHVEREYPYHFETQTNLGTCYLKTRDYDLAEQYYLRALNITPNDEQVLFNLGILSMQQDKIDVAISYYQKALQVNPNHFAAHNNLGIAYMMLKKPTDALMHFQEALRIQPANAAIKHTIRILMNDSNVMSSPAAYIQTLFDSYADHYEDHLVHGLSYDVPEKLLEAFNAGTDAQHELLDILDIGCGTGLCGAVFKKYARRLVGVDLSEQMLVHAKEKHIYDELVCSDIVTFLKQHESQYDLILAADVIVYFGDLTEIFNVLTAALRVQGYFIFSIETGAATDYKMTSSGRFTHSQMYIERLANHNQLMIRHHRQVTLRTHEQTPVLGEIFVLQRQ